MGHPASCPNCGEPWAPTTSKCWNCQWDSGDWSPLAKWGAGVGPEPGRIGPVIPPDQLPPVLTRTYHGRPGDVELLREADADALAQRGYYPTSQNYVPGYWSLSAWVFAFIALIFLIGIVILAYMIATKPAGDLTVIYELRDPPPTVAGRPEATMPQPRAETTAMARLRTLDDLKSADMITEDEYVARRKSILDDI